jgi:GT2 family glycosyltransferase
MVLSYNHPDLTARAVESALRHWPYESTYLVHNGSLSKNIELLKVRFPAIRHIHIRENRGYSGGVNAGLTEVFKLNSWAVVLTNDCELLTRPSLPATPSVSFPKIFRRKTTMLDSFGGFFEPHLAKIGHHRENPGAKSYFYAPGSALAVHRNVFQHVGCFDETLVMYWEDVDWSMRVKEAGFNFNGDESWHVRHGIGKTCHKDPLYSLYYFQRNRKRVSWKYSSRARRPLLGLLLARDWLGLSIRLARKKRWSDLKFLGRAIVD